MTLSDVIDTLQTWIRNADDEYDREEMGRVAGLKEALHEIKRIEPCEDAISRQKLLKAIATLDKYGCDADKKLVLYKDHYVPYIRYYDVVNCIKCVLPVKPQDTKEAYNKGFADGQKALVEHLKLCKEEQGWIPVSERLPLLRGLYKISDDVLITNGYENDMGYLVERKGKIFWHYYGGECEVGIKDEDNDAIAWMPLPEPYKAESEDKE